jgi:hypothetical protein
VFMLFQREDLRDRLIRLAGAHRLNLTTTVLDDAARRVSRYLLAQLAINAGYGLVAGIALYVIGVPNPLLWGLLAALLRYIPYLGIWVAAAMPAAVAFAVEPGWVKVPIVFGVFIGIDLVMYNLVEPLLYGTSTGVSPLAILVAAVFWTWLWGPVGLLLATPLTVCVVVLGRHVPHLGFLEVMLSDEPVLSVETRVYQRLLAMDLEEATEMAEAHLRGRSLEDVFDEVLIPVLSLAEDDRHQGKIDEARQRFVYQNARILVEDLAERADELISANGGGKSRPAPPETSTAAALRWANGTAVVCAPAHDEADAIAAFMLALLLRRRQVPVRVALPGELHGELLALVEAERPAVVCVTSVPPFGYMHVRYQCRKLKAGVPDVKVVAAFLTEGEVADIKNRKPEIPADGMASNLKSALGQALTWLEAPGRETPAVPHPTAIS